MKSKAAIYNYLFSSTGAIFAIVTGIVMVPYYLKYISLSEYGSWLASGNIVAMFGILESGIAGIITQKLAIEFSAKNYRNFGALTFSTIVLGSGIFLIISFAGLFIYKFIPNWVNAPNESASVLSIAVLLSFFSAGFSILFSFCGAFAQAWQETFWSGISNLLSFLISIVIIVLALNYGLGIISIALGYLTRSCLNFLGQLSYIFYKWKKLNLTGLVYSLKTTRKLIIVATFPLLSKISNTVVNNSQSFIIANAISPASAAIFDFTGKIISIVKIFINIFYGSIFGGLAHVFVSNNSEYIKETYLKIYNIFSVILIVGLTISCIFSREIITLWVGESNFGGIYLVLLITISTYFTERKNFAVNLLFASGEFKTTSIADIINSIMYFSFIYLSINYCGILALPISLLLSGVIMVYYYEKKAMAALNMIWSKWLFNSLEILLISIVLILIYYWVGLFTNSLVILSGKIIIITGFYFVLLFLFSKTYKSVVFSLKEIFIGH